MKFFNYKNKVTLMRKAREMGNIFYNGMKISFYPDYSPDLQKRRAEFLEVKRTFQKLKLTYALLYPARLRVEALEGTQIFDSPVGVTSWLEDNRERLQLN